MKFSVSAALLAAMAVGQAAAATTHHVHGVKKHNHAARHADALRAEGEKQAQAQVHQLAARDSNALLSMGLKAVGLNPTSKTSGKPWIGNDGDFTNEFINDSDEDLYLVIWGSWGSWVNAIQPDITVPIAKGQSKTISFPHGSTGAWAPIYGDTKLVMGQISETWGEFTFNDLYSTVDVSREVNMSGRNMRIVTPKCTSDMNTCVFVCPQGQNTCMTGYSLENCTPGSQGGANHGYDAGAPSGGCSGMGSSASLKTHLGYSN